MIFEVSSGKVLSGRSYSAGGDANFKYDKRSLIVSSGPSPMAFVLSNYDMCTG